MALEAGGPDFRDSRLVADVIERRVQVHRGRYAELELDGALEQLARRFELSTGCGRSQPINRRRSRWIQVSVDIERSSAYTFIISMSYLF